MRFVEQKKAGAFWIDEAGHGGDSTIF